jgi:hypothetical protein
MTDREMALALGHYVNSLLQKVSALEGAFLEYRVTNEQGQRVEIPFREDVKRIEKEESFQRLSGAQSASLLQAIGDETQPSALIRALCRHYFVE